MNRWTVQTVLDEYNLKIYHNKSKNLKQQQNSNVAQITNNEQYVLRVGED